MKEFYLNNKVTYNLMSFTGFKALLLFSYLLEQPRTYNEIHDYFLSHAYLKETISRDTLRVYLNSLKMSGCEISKQKTAEGIKYSIHKHPFELQIPDEYIKNLVKVFKLISKSIEIEELYSLTKFFQKMADCTNNETLKALLLNVSPLSKLNNDILNFLILACRKKEEIKVLYKSPSSGEKEITILAEKLEINNNKVNLLGTSPNYENHASLLVSRIIAMPVINIRKTVKPKDDIKIICEIYDNDIVLAENERLIKQDNEIRTVEITTDNLFYARQRILSLGYDCKVIAPQSFKDDILSILKKMKEGYVERNE